MTNTNQDCWNEYTKEDQEALFVLAVCAIEDGSILDSKNANQLLDLLVRTTRRPKEKGKP